MLNKELNNEMEASTEWLEEEQIDIECVLKCIDIMHRYTNELIQVKRFAYILGAKEVHSYYTESFKRVEFRNLYNGIAILEIKLFLDNDDITNKESLPRLIDEFKDIKYVANCISTILKLSKRGIYIKGIEELPDDQAQFITYTGSIHEYIIIDIQ